MNVWIIWKIWKWSKSRWNISQVLGKKVNIQEIKNKFWFDVKYLDSDWLDVVYDVQYHTQEEVVEILGRLHRDVLSKYPEWFIKSSYLREVYLFKDIKDRNWNSVWWFELRWKIYLNTSWNNIYKFHHELFHRFDNKDGESDDKMWEQLFWKVSRLKWKDFSTTMDNTVPWYSNIYGMTQWINEDQATIAEYLLSPNKKKDFLLRLKTDEVLRNKDWDKIVNQVAIEKIKNLIR